MPAAPAALDEAGDEGGELERERRPVLAAAHQQGLAADEDPDGAVGAEEEPEAAEAPGGLGDERSALDELGRSGSRARRWAVTGRGDGVAARTGRWPCGVDEEERPLAVEQQRRPLGGLQVGGVVEAQPRRVGEHVDDDDAVREVVGLHPGAAELDEVLEGLADEVGVGTSVRQRRMAGQHLDGEGVAEGSSRGRVERARPGVAVGAEPRGRHERRRGQGVEDGKQPGALGRDHGLARGPEPDRAGDPPAHRPGSGRRRRAGCDLGRRWRRVRGE